MRSPKLMPAAVRWPVLALTGLAVASAVYLVAVRWQAILVDLEQIGSRMWCF